MQTPARSENWPYKNILKVRMNKFLTTTALAIMASIMLFATNTLAGDAGTVQGRVMHKGEPVAGAKVYAVEKPDDIFGEPDTLADTVSGEDGTFSMELDRGNFYVAAKTDAKEGAPAMYSFYGGNPVSVDPARPVEITLNLTVRPDEPVVTTGGKYGGVEGVVTFEGEPLSGVVLFVYLDSNNAFRGMGYYMSPPTGVDGRFRLRMGPGTYYVVARKRMGGSMAGPLREGDYFGYLEINPVVVEEEGMLYKVEVPLVQKVERASPGGHGKTLITGVIRDPDGNAVPGVRAVLYKSADMMNRPAHMSEPSGPDGSFEVEVPIGGTYYLAARDTIGGPVEPGQLYGRYNEDPEHAVSIETGKSVKGLVITVEEVE